MGVVGGVGGGRAFLRWGACERSRVQFGRHVGNLIMAHFLVSATLTTKYEVHQPREPARCGAFLVSLQCPYL